jgi:hypothetical protein
MVMTNEDFIILIEERRIVSGCGLVSCECYLWIVRGCVTVRNEVGGC